MLLMTLMLLLISVVGVNIPVTDSKGLLSVVLTLLALYLMLMSMFL